MTESETAGSAHASPTRAERIASLAWLGVAATRFAGKRYRTSTHRGAVLPEQSAPRRWWSIGAGLSREEHSPTLPSPPLRIKVLSKPELVASLQHEVRILLHLAGKIDRTQLFLYLKASGNDRLTTMNLWAGIDEPAKA